METRWSEEANEGQVEPEGGGAKGLSFEEIKARLQALNEQVKGFIRERPTACLLGAVAVGYVVARLARRR